MRVRRKYEIPDVASLMRATLAELDKKRLGTIDASAVTVTADSIPVHQVIRSKSAVSKATVGAA
jgi:hypothetical protein